VITSHTYDAGWPRYDDAGCIADVETADGDVRACRRPLHEHSASEYPSDTLERRLADASPVTLADVVRMLDLPSGAGPRYAWAMQHTPDDVMEFTLPPALPGCRRLHIRELVQAAAGRNPEGQPLWRAGDILRWGRNTNRLDHVLLPKPRHPAHREFRRA
jgi:hypothetical protein